MRGYKVLDVREFNTSQVCSLCHFDVKMGEASSTKDRQLDVLSGSSGVAEVETVITCEGANLVVQFGTARNMLHLGSLESSGQPRPH